MKTPHFQRCIEPLRRHLRSESSCCASSAQRMPRSRRFHEASAQIEFGMPFAAKDPNSRGSRASPRCTMKNGLWARKPTMKLGIPHFFLKPFHEEMTIPFYEEKEAIF